MHVHTMRMPGFILDRPLTESPCKMKFRKFFNCNTYAYFIQHDNATQVREANPDMKITEISKVLGARWKEMDEKQKAPYQKKADADKARLVKHQNRPQCGTGVKRDE